MSQYAYDYNPRKTQDFRKTTISVDQCHKWTKDHMYRTSYASMKNNQPVESKNVVYSGYGGFVPSLKSDNHFGERYSQITRNCFNDTKLGENTFKLSSTGFNYKRHNFVDPSLTASTHKYGAQTLQKPNPCLHPKEWRSTSNEAFGNPKGRINPTFRETDKNLQTQKYKTKTSGFQQNHELFDRTGWVPEKVLHGERKNTEYRLRYNPDVPFHREVKEFQIRKKDKKQYNYKFT